MTTTTPNENNPNPDPFYVIQMGGQDIPLLLLNSQGFSYKGVLIEDAGEAYAAWMEVMGILKNG